MPPRLAARKMATLLTQFLAVNDFRSGSERRPDVWNLGTAGRSMTREILLGRSIFPGGRTGAAKFPLRAVRRIGSGTDSAQFQVSAKGVRRFARKIPGGRVQAMQRREVAAAAMAPGV
jgi:hypothetical protein